MTTTPSTMEIDDNNNNTNPLDGVRETVLVHPLALVHMSDQYTRIRAGGSPLEASAPVVGLLFGKQQQQQQQQQQPAVLEIEDAGDIPLDDAEKQIELHQAVFPRHQVMGWYKVVIKKEEKNGSGGGKTSAAAVEPTVEDLKQTQYIQTRYQTKQSSDAMQLFFGLLTVPSTKKTTTKKKNKSSNKSATTNLKSTADEDGDATMKSENSSGKNEPNDNDEDDNDDDDELPLTLYRLDPTNGGRSLIAVPTWSLHTSESERIAVQRVMREKKKSNNPVAMTTIPTDAALFLTNPATNATAPSLLPGSAAATTSAATALSHHPYLSVLSLDAVTPQIVTPYTEEIQESFAAISTRLGLIVQYLESLPPPNNNNCSVPQLSLLRHVRGLLLQLGAIAGTAPPSSSSPNTNYHLQQQQQQQQFQQLTSLAKAVDAVTLFTEKFRFLHEHGGGNHPRSSGGVGGHGREVRRF